MKFGLIGHPIAHSLSPALFGAGYDGRFPYDLIQGEDFETSYQRFSEEYDGINVTAPFKELAYAKADLPSEECRLIKATNLLIKTSEGVRAYNSDFLGVRWLWPGELGTYIPGQKNLVVKTGFSLNGAPGFKNRKWRSQSSFMTYFKVDKYHSWGKKKAANPIPQLTFTKENTDKYAADLQKFLLIQFLFPQLHAGDAPLERRLHLLIQA